MSAQRTHQNNVAHAVTQVAHTLIQSYAPHLLSQHHLRLRGRGTCRGIMYMWSDAWTYTDTRLLSKHIRTHANTQTPTEPTHTHKHALSLSLSLSHTHTHLLSKLNLIRGCVRRGRCSDVGGDKRQLIRLSLLHMRWVAVVGM